MGGLPGGQDFCMHVTAHLRSLAAGVLQGGCSCVREVPLRSLDAVVDTLRVRLVELALGPPLAGGLLDVSKRQEAGDQPDDEHCCPSDLVHDLLFHDSPFGRARGYVHNTILAHNLYNVNIIYLRPLLY